LAVIEATVASASATSPRRAAGVLGAVAQPTITNIATTLAEAIAVRMATPSEIDVSGHVRVACPPATQGHDAKQMPPPHSPQ
jgi:hypothetical protein